MASPADTLRPIWRDDNGNRLVHCPECRFPAGKIVNGTLTFRTKHNGETHHVAISLELLQKWLTETNADVVCSAAAASIRQ